MMYRKWLIIGIAICFVMVYPVEIAEAQESKDYVDTENKEFFGAHISFEVLTKIVAEKTTWTYFGKDKNWILDDYSAQYEVKVNPLYSDSYTSNNWVPDPYYADASQLDNIDQTFIPQLISEDEGDTYQLFSGSSPLAGLVDDIGVDEWTDLFSDSIRPYESVTELFGQDRGYWDDYFGEDDSDIEKAQAFFGDTTSFYGGMNKVDAFGADDGLWSTHLTVTSDVDFYDGEDNYYGSDKMTFDIPVSLPGPVELNGVGKRIVQTMEVDIWFPVPKSLNLSNPYFTDVTVVGTKVTGSDWHQLIRGEPIGAFDTLVRTTDYVVKTYIVPYATWGYWQPGSEYDNDPPEPTGKQYPDGGTPDPNIALFGGLVGSTSIKLLYQCQPGGGDNSGSQVVPGFEVTTALAALFIIIIYRRRER